jgi:hypothetical protein
VLTVWTLVLNIITSLYTKGQTTYGVACKYTKEDASA